MALVVLVVLVVTRSRGAFLFGVYMFEKQYMVPGEGSGIMNDVGVAVAGWFRGRCRHLKA